LNRTTFVRLASGIRVRGTLALVVSGFFEPTCVSVQVIRELAKLVRQGAEVAGGSCGGYEQVH
jgi:hypothetical protein